MNKPKDPQNPPLDDLEAWNELVDGVKPLAGKKPSQQPSAAADSTDSADATHVDDFDTLPPAPEAPATPLPEDDDPFYAAMLAATPAPPPPPEPTNWAADKWAAEVPANPAPPAPSVPKPQNTFHVDAQDEQLIGWRGGVDSRLRQRLAKGEVPFTRRLDLHGYYLLEAYQALRAFITSSHAAGHRCVLVIHGKGQSATGGHGVIKQNIGQLLAEQACVLAYHSAVPRHGGTGAVYVLLRKQRKT